MSFIKFTVFFFLYILWGIIGAHKYRLTLKTKTSNHNDDDDCWHLDDDGLKVCCMFADFYRNKFMWHFTLFNYRQK